jgi:hypothetical protein
MTPIGFLPFKLFKSTPLPIALFTCSTVHGARPQAAVQAAVRATLSCHILYGELAEPPHGSRLSFLEG